MDFGLLINAVECEKCLYDKKDKNYKNSVVKEAAWSQIAKVTDMSKEDCKKRWNLLREKFNKEQKKLEQKSGDSPLPYEEEWPYTESMMFLKKFIQPRKTKSNHFEETFESELQTDYTTESEVQVVKRGKVDPFIDTCNAFKEAIQEFRERQNVVQQPTQSDPDDLFLQSVKGLLKDLPENVKGQARVDILSYVTNLRNQHLGNLDDILIFLFNIIEFYKHFN